MKDLWYQKNPSGHDRFVLAGAVGGTTTNLGLVGLKEGYPELLHEFELPSREVGDFPSLVAQTVLRYETALPGVRVASCSVGAQGPVKDNYCHIHNLAWQIDGEAVRQASGLPTVIVNDFTAVSYALPFVQTSNPDQAVVLQSGAGPLGTTRAVIGLGAELRVGAVVQAGDRAIAMPSEAGQMDFAPFDNLTEAFRTFVEKRVGTFPSVELCCSTIGLRHLFLFAKSSGWLDHSQAILAEIEAQGIDEAPRIVAHHADHDVACRRILDTFVRIFARFTSNIAATLLPFAGLYLVGDLPTQNLTYFTERDLFRKTFLQHQSGAMRTTLDQVPLAVILNFNTALVGAANAGLNLL